MLSYSKFKQVLQKRLMYDGCRCADPQAAMCSLSKKARLTMLEVRRRRRRKGGRSSAIVGVVATAVL